MNALHRDAHEPASFPPFVRLEAGLYTHPWGWVVTRGRDLDAPRRGRGWVIYQLTDDDDFFRAAASTAREAMALTERLWRRPRRRVPTSEGLRLRLRGTSTGDERPFDVTSPIADGDIVLRQKFKDSVTCGRRETPTFRRWDPWCDVARYLASLPNAPIACLDLQRRLIG